MNILLKGSPCDTCEQKEEDEYGLVCDIACGAYTANANFMLGAKEQLKRVAEHIKNLSTDGHDKWYWYHQDLANALLKECEE